MWISVRVLRRGVRRLMCEPWDVCVNPTEQSSDLFFLLSQGYLKERSSGLYVSAGIYL